MWLHDLDEFVAKLDEVEGKYKYKYKYKYSQVEGKENQETKDQQETQQKGFKKVVRLIHPPMTNDVLSSMMCRWRERREW